MAGDGYSRLTDNHAPKVTVAKGDAVELYHQAKPDVVLATGVVDRLVPTNGSCVVVLDDVKAQAGHHLAGQEVRLKFSSRGAEMVNRFVGTAGPLRMIRKKTATTA